MGRDKAGHFVVGGLIGMVGMVLGVWWAGTLILAAICGALKEVVWDGVMGKGEMEVWDFVATVVGGVVGVGIAMMILKG